MLILLPRHHFDFNSIKVRLELNIEKDFDKWVNHFNSIKVRLEQSDSFVLQWYQRLFQFHKGTIRTVRVNSKGVIVSIISIP